MFVLNEAYNPGNQVPYISINRNDLAAHSLPSGEVCCLLHHMCFNYKIKAWKDVSFFTLLMLSFFPPFAFQICLK